MAVHFYAFHGDNTPEKPTPLMWSVIWAVRSTLLPITLLQHCLFCFCDQTRYYYIATLQNIELQIGLRTLCT